MTERIYFRLEVFIFIPIFFFQGMQMKNPVFRCGLVKPFATCGEVTEKLAAVTALSSTHFFPRPYQHPQLSLPRMVLSSTFSLFGFFRSESYNSSPANLPAEDLTVKTKRRSRDVCLIKSRERFQICFCA